MANLSFGEREDDDGIYDSLCIYVLCSFKSIAAAQLPPFSLHTASDSVLKRWRKKIKLTSKYVKIFGSPENLQNIFQRYHLKTAGTIILGNICK